jgi:SAM-dependent methyltransferase
MNQEILNLFKDRNGIEIGGLSRIFEAEGKFPIYPIVKSLDGCNFSSQTLWESGLKEGMNYKFHENKVGFQYICEATEIDNRIPWGTYDFLISSNCLEHIANPLKAFEAFKKIIKFGGLIILILPNKDVTFDHNRQITSYRHLYEDYRNNVGENDLSHLNEILELHDLSMDPPAGNKEQFKERSLKNFENRGLHQHVFDDNLLKNIYDAMNIKILFNQNIGSDYIIGGEK